MGQRLAKLLNTLIDRRIGDDRTRGDLVSAMAGAAGIDAGTVNQILSGEIVCPPMARLEGFARVLDVSVEDLRDAAAEDGCAYESEAANASLARPVRLPDASVPEWIHLLPVGVIETEDGRGPYRATQSSLAGILEASLQQSGGRLPIDENHSTDLAVRSGSPAPARGWISKLEARTDGVWGLVEWTRSGTELMADGAYRFVSPVIMHTADGTVKSIIRVALTNKPNLRQLKALNTEEDMDLLASLCAALGLDNGTDEATVLAKVKELKGSTAKAALQTAEALSPIAAAAGAPEGADADAVLAAVNALKDPAKMVPASQVAALQSELGELRSDVARDKATAAVDAAIAAGKPGVKNLRDHYIARHMADPDAVATELAGLPSLTGSTYIPPTPPDRDGNVALNASQRQVARLIGVPEDAYQKTLKAEADARQEAV